VAWRLGDEFSDQGYLVGLVVHLGINEVSVRVDEPLYRFVQRGNMHIRPVQLGDTSVERMTHGATLNA
jgi:hypothetical protein